MRTVLWFLRTFWFMVTAIPQMKKAEKMKESGDPGFHEFVDSRVRVWAQNMMKYAGMTAEIHGQENFTDVPAVYVANHQSNFDIPLMLSSLPTTHGIVAKDSIGKIPLIRTWMDYLGCVFLDRSDARKAIRTLNEAGSQIPEGRSITIFPEGTRSRCDDVGEFKNGAFKTAFKYNAPIVPVAIDGTYRIMEANGGKWIKPGHVAITVLPMIETEGMDRAQQKALPELVRQQIIDAREATREEIAKRK